MSIKRTLLVTFRNTEAVEMQDPVLYAHSALSGSHRVNKPGSEILSSLLPWFRQPCTQHWFCECIATAVPNEYHVD